VQRPLPDDALKFVVCGTDKIGPTHNGSTACALWSVFVITTATISAAEPVQGQTYDPRYPVCMQTYGPISGINCTYTSLANCRLLVRGRSAQCLTNPYFVQKPKSRR
jgi:hypothetical protein